MNTEQTAKIFLNRNDTYSLVCTTKEGLTLKAIAYPTKNQAIAHAVLMGYNQEDGTLAISKNCK